ncbi:N-acetylmuramoyl-L-alanine amidase [Streptomyces alboflavus]|uniref:N-acetylmuramoyl-L-alanine amidase n=1 Tax=Streptomyces alboflavus TaxID=67267 RepID=A0A1Z1W502_9ACTN|nr:N-acetylmuramoyl-L-alanine amidase [Streptomyces alboflavus]
MTASQLLVALEAEGVTVVEVGNWREHNRNHVGPWGPVHGVMIHHTVTTGSAATVRICRDGHSTLPGPLCHGVITKDGRVHLVGYGRSNHAGLGDDDVLQAVINEKALPADNEANTDGNRHFYGFECENLGNGTDPWPAAQLQAIERVSAAICRHHGWGAGSVIGHLEWQPGKIDPKGFSMQTMRGRIAARLDNNTAPEEDPMAGISSKDICEAVWETDGVVGVPDGWGAPGNTEWKPASILIDMGKRLRTLQAQQSAQAATVNELVKTVATLAAGLGDLDPAAIVAELRAAIESIEIRLDVPDAS